MQLEGNKFCEYETDIFSMCSSWHVRWYTRSPIKSNWSFCLQGKQDVRKISGYNFNSWMYMQLGGQKKIGSKRLQISA